MNFQEWMADVKKQGKQVPRPLELLGGLDESRVMAHLSDKKAAYSGDALPMKVKALIALAAGIALDSSPCILNNTKAAKEAGASTAEILETFAVAKFSKGATAISSALPALEWLAESK